MTLIACWILFPVVLGLLAAGCGLLLERASGLRLPGVLIPPAGLAVVVVVAEIATSTDATAELAAPLVVVCAVAGFVLSRRRLAGVRPDRWAAGAALGVFAVFAAPTVLSGEATFAGYLKIEDTAIWVAITDHVMQHGHDVSGLSPSSYEAILDTYLGHGYPAGSFLPLGVGHVLTGQDVAWLLQPYLAFLAVMLALSFYALAAPLVESRRLRALAVFIAAQAALLFAYALWGAIKELAAAWLIATLAALTAPILREEGGARRALPLAVTAAAAIAALSAGAGVWLLPLLVPVLVLGFVLRGERIADQAAFFLGATALLSLPSLLRASSFLSVAGDTLTTQSELGNLSGPLDPLQAFGIWPVGDFRAEPSALTLTHVLIAVVVVAAVAGAVWAWRRRAYEALIYVPAVVVGALIITGAGSPWTDGKALAILSGTLVFAGMVGAVASYEAGWRVPAVIATIAIAAGVLWSNVLAYHEVDLAPRDRLAELQTIGDRIDGDGPTLTTEYEYWGARHFLRKGDPDSSALTHRGNIELQDGSAIQEGQVVDVNQINTRDLLRYRTLVLRRSPLASRPPAPYRLIWSGRYYEAWQIPKGTPPLLRHVPLGIGDPAAVPCRQVLGIARGAGAGNRIAAAERPPPLRFDVTESVHPRGWEVSGSALYPDSSGAAKLRVRVPVAGRYGLWLGGAFRGGLRLQVDDKTVRSARNELNYSGGEYIPMGVAELSAGAHTVTLRYDGPDLHPGSGGNAIAPFGDLPKVPFAIGPLVLSRATAAVPVTVVDPARARSLCGKTLDWIDVIGPG
jgi:hypothetical protein